MWYRDSLFGRSWLVRLRFLMSIRGMVQIYAQTDCYNLLRVLLRASPNKIGRCNTCNTCNKKNITLNNNNICIWVRMCSCIYVSCQRYKRYKRYNSHGCWLYPRNAIQLKRYTCNKKGGINPPNLLNRVTTLRANIPHLTVFELPCL